MSSSEVRDLEQLESLALAALAACYDSNYGRSLRIQPNLEIEAELDAVGINWLGSASC